MKRRHRAWIVLACLLALVWCQVAAAAQGCMDAGTSQPPPCHVDDTAAGATGATFCAACVDGQQPPAPADVAHPLLPAHDVFAPLAVRAAADVPRQRTHVPPSHAPPIFRARLRI